MSAELPEDLELVDSPTDAHRAMLALLHDTVVEAARQRQDELPGLVETLQDDVVLTAGGTTRRAYGWFAARAWRYHDRHVHEVFINADRRVPHPQVSEAEGILVTLLHEACHVYARANGIKDTSRDGRWHNRKFAEIALAIGVQVERDARIGHRTPRLTARGRYDYNDLLSRLDRGLVLVREPQLTRSGSGGSGAGGGSGDADAHGSSDPEVPSAKYVFASCQCRDGRLHPVTIRVAKGSWRPSAICCSVCEAPFRESLTSQRQSDQR